ncbi:MAG TPA: pantetheine-phosphate adenylyltransferase [Burkholderiaceae bacterium]|jgi:pantetheine-phosphate adenylyltransferase|nr:pantetheine-phosphate adenylyltransferase [Burkholderiaceae bacterium]
MKAIAFSGTLDPITNGHMWVIGEARSLADDVTIFLSENTLKKPQFPAEERKRIIEQSAAEKGWNNVHVVIVKSDYTARVAKKRGIDYLIRGIRTTSDFDYENLIQQTNVDVLHGAKTIFVMPPRDLGSVSSSFVRTLQGPVGWHWNMKKFVPRPAYQAWILDWLRKEWESLWQAHSGVDSDYWFTLLTGETAYGGANRHYHNLDHLVHGLTEIKAWAARTDAKGADIDMLKMAFWFHDAVYGQVQEQVSDEEASARLWLTSKLDAAAAAGSADLIRVTDHFQASAISHPLKHVMLGVDLAILGQDEDVYDTYARAIRREYQHVPEQEYKTNRRNALIHLCDKAKAGLLYGDAYFAEQYGAAAISNMTREIETLSAT